MPMLALTETNNTGNPLEARTVENDKKPCKKVEKPDRAATPRLPYANYLGQGRIVA